MDCFKRSGAAALYHLFLFAFTLSCGWLASRLLDAAITSNFPAAIAAAACLTAALAMGLPAVYLWRRALGRLLREDRQRFRERQYEAVAARRLPVEDPGELDVRLGRDADTAAAFFQSALPQLLESGGVLLGSAALLCRTHLGLGLLLFALSLLQFLPSVVYEKWAKEIYHQSSDAEEDLDGWFVQGYDGLSTLKSCRREDWFLEKVAQNTERMIRAGSRSEKAGTVETIVLEFVDGLLRYGSYVILGLFVLRGGLSVSDTPVLIVLSGYLFDGVKNLMEAMQQIFSYQAAKKRLAEVPEPGPRCLLAPEAAKGVLLEAAHLQKCYGKKAVLEDISLTVRPGDRVLVSGPNGSGKSTLLRIALGLLRADGGQIRHGAGTISFALQEEAALPLTGAALVEDLLAEGAVDGMQLRQYLRGFRIDGNLLGKPLTDWSMGERKKFYLAAAFARGGDLLALDEPTNHLDAAARKYLQNLTASYPGAVLAVSHREELPIDWDRMVDLKGGPT